MHISERRRGADFGEAATTSLGYCRGGDRMLVFLVLLDPSGVTVTGGGVTVIHQSEHQLPIAVFAFDNPHPAPPRPMSKRQRAGGGRRPGETHHDFLMRLTNCPPPT